MGAENRRWMRSLTESPVQISVGEDVFIVGAFQDFSKIGARVQVPCYVKPRTFIKIGYKNHLLVPQMIYCAVIWVKSKSHQHFEMGLQFIAY